MACHLYIVLSMEKNLKQETQVKMEVASSLDLFLASLNFLLLLLRNTVQLLHFYKRRVKREVIHFRHFNNKTVTMIVARFHDYQAGGNSDESCVTDKSNLSSDSAMHAIKG